MPPCFFGKACAPKNTFMRNNHEQLIIYFQPSLRTMINDVPVMYTLRAMINKHRPYILCSLNIVSNVAVTVNPMYLALAMPD